MSDELKKVVQTDKAIFGTDKTMKELKKGRISQVYITSNTPDVIKEDLAHYCKIANITLENVDMTNDELGTLCKKNFSVSVIGVKK